MIFSRGQASHKVFCWGDVAEALTQMSVAGCSTPFRDQRFMPASFDARPDARTDFCQEHHANSFWKAWCFRCKGDRAGAIPAQAVCVRWASVASGERSAPPRPAWFYDTAACDFVSMEISKLARRGQVWSSCTPSELQSVYRSASYVLLSSCG